MSDLSTHTGRVAAHESIDDRLERGEITADAALSERIRLALEIRKVDE